MNRRNFIKLLSVVPLIGSSTATLADNLNNKSLFTPEYLSQLNYKYLILVELKGGNDGLNTLVPYGEELYYKSRPKIALQEKQVLKINDTIGMHESLAQLNTLWESKQLAWVQGVGYPNPNRSHFKSIDIWDTAQLNQDEQLEGWVSQYRQDTLKGIAINSNLGPLYTLNSSTISLQSLESLIKLKNNITHNIEQENQGVNDGLQHILATQVKLDNLIHELLKKLPLVPKPQQNFPKNSFGNDLNSVYTLIATGLDVPVYKVSLGSFDTHVSQLGRQAGLFKSLSDGLMSLVQNLKYLGVWDNTLIMTYSEFGRRLQENANQGTDHGTAAPHMILGGSVKGGLYGKYPSLYDLDDRGDLIYTVDFRDIYSTIASRWWGKEIQKPILDFI